MQTVQKTSIAGTGGLAVFFTAFKNQFASVPLDSFWAHAQTLTIGQTLEIIVPLVLGIIGIVYNEDKSK